MLSDVPHEMPFSIAHNHACRNACTYLSAFVCCPCNAVFKLLIVCLADIKYRATGEYVVSFEVWHQKLIKDAERYYEQKQEEYG